MNLLLVCHLFLHYWQTIMTLLADYNDIYAILFLAPHHAYQIQHTSIALAVTIDAGQAGQKTVLNEIMKEA